jgi:hypothetical protein
VWRNGKACAEEPPDDLVVARLSHFKGGLAGNTSVKKTPTLLLEAVPAERRPKIRAGDQSRRPNATRTLPVMYVMYCLPSAM